MTYWFVAFLSKRPDETSWTPHDAMIFGEHPTEYIARAREAYGTNEYRLTFFTPIPEDIYFRLNPPIDEPGALPRQTAR